jgi:HlyD family secretion protein
MGLMKRTFALVSVAVLVVAGLGYVGVRHFQRSSAAGDDYQTAQVQRGSLVATISTAGMIQTADAVDLSFQVSGQVVEVKVQEGDPVKAGQEIACLDTTEAQLEVAQAEISLDNAQNQLAAAKKGASAEELASAKASLASAQENLKALQAGPAASDVEAARLALDKAKNSLWGAQCQRDATCGNPNAGGSACDQANASVANAEIAVELARMDYEKAQQGPDAKELRAAEAQVAQAQLSLSKLTDTPTSEDVHAAENQVKQAELSLQQARLKLAQCCLTAPFDGTLTSLDLRAGQMAGPSTQAARLAGTGGLEVAADMAEADVASVKVGQEAEIVLDAMPERAFTGRVAGVASAGTNVQGVVNFPITISLDEADAAIKPGMTANVAIVVDQRDDVLLAPSRAIQVQGRQHLVRVLHEGQVIEVPVEVGLSGDNGTEILGDTLREGDVLVLNGATTASPAAGLQRGMPGGLGGIMLRR